MSLPYFALTIAAALVGAYLAERLHLPAGGMFGAIIAVTAVNLLGGTTVFYPIVRTVMQVFTGVMIGSKFGREELYEMRTIGGPILFSLACLAVLNLTFGMAMYKLSNLDVATAFFASVPGGLSDIAIISGELGANTVYVGLLQLFRILMIYITMPPLFRKLFANKKPEQEASAHKEEKSDPAEPFQYDLRYLRRFSVRFFISLAGGLLCGWIGLPAGTMTGSMVASAVLNIKVDKIVFPPIAFYLKALAGAYVAVGITRESFASFGELLIPLAIMAVGIVVFTLGMGFGMHKVFKTDLAMCMLAATPGGIQEMCLLSEDLGSDTLKIAVIHTVRFMFVILLFPMMIRIVTTLVGS